jgi:YbgC/YbaW family acyl-CoA thioester hydrolase
MSVPPPPLPGWAIHQCDFLVVEQEIDLLGHLNNVSAMALFERARWNMLTERGYGFDTLQSAGQAPVILSVDVQFRREVRLRQRVTIASYTSSASGKVGVVTQVMRAADDTVHIVANYTIGLFDLTTRRLVPPSNAWRAATGEPEPFA